MRVLLLSLLVLFSVSAAGQSFGPAGCPAGQVYDDCNHTSASPAACVSGCRASTPVSPPATDKPTGPVELCIQAECRLVTYYWIGNIVVAESQLANGYAVIGWSGPCLAASRGECPDILNQAFADLTTNAKRANRAQSVQ